KGAVGLPVRIRVLPSIRRTLADHNLFNVFITQDLYTRAKRLHREKSEERFLIREGPHSPCARTYTSLEPTFTFLTENIRSKSMWGGCPRKLGPCTPKIPREVYCWTMQRFPKLAWHAAFASFWLSSSLRVRGLPCGMASPPSEGYRESHNGNPSSLTRSVNF